MRSAIRLAVAVASAGISTLAVAAPAVAAPTAALGQCTTTRGTIVAVDFGHWEGPIVRGCGVQSNGQPDPTGLVLLHDGGFDTTGSTHDGPAFVCRIGSGSFSGGTQYPTPAQVRCLGTPPASASWSFWLAAPGATSWHYSDNGANGDHPAAGEVELWTFGGSAAPASSLIDELRAHNTTAPSGSGPPEPPGQSPPSQPTHQDGTTSRGSLGGTGLAANGTASRQPTDGRSSSSSASPRGSVTTPPSAGASKSVAAGTIASAGAPSIVAAAAAPKTPHSSGSALPVVITVVVVAALGGLGGLSFVRRRRRVGD